MSPNGQKLRVAVPVKHGFKQFVDVGGESKTGGHPNITGYCIEVFDAVMSNMPYPVSYEYVPFPSSSESYDNLVSLVPEQVSTQYTPGTYHDARRVCMCADREASLVGSYQW
jgi:hypothetical protein